MFRIEVIGNLGADAEIKSDNGRQYVRFSVADTRRFTDSAGNKQEVTNWFSCFMHNTEAEVIKYLKKGTRVFVRGNGELRLFSSEKDRKMKAGASLNVQEIELVGGGSEDVPRQLAEPSGKLLQVYKAYYVDTRSLSVKGAQALYDRRGNMFNIDANGVVAIAQLTVEHNEELVEEKIDDYGQQNSEIKGDSSQGGKSAPF